MATSPPAPAAAEAGAQAKPKSKKLLIIIIAVVVLLAGGGGAAWFFLMKKPHGDETAEEAPKKPVHPPTFMPLETMVVNLGDPAGDRFAQIGITLELSEAEAEAKIKAQLPTVRSGVLLLISQRTSAELLTIDGKNRLASDIRAIVSNALGFHMEMSKPPAPKPAESAASAAGAMPVALGGAPSATSSAPASAAEPEHKGEEAKASSPKKAAKEKDSHGGGDETPVANVLFNSFIIQ